MKCLLIFVLVTISCVLAHPRDGTTTAAPHIPAAQRASCRNNGGLTMTNLNGRQYYFHTDVATKKNWHEAFDFCKQHCMDLATIETRQENDAITRKVNTLLSDDDTRFTSFFWIGMNDLGKEGEFRWASTGDVVTFTDWHPNTPDNQLVGENCGDLLKLHRVVKWNDRGCRNKGRFICEKP